MLPSIVVPVYNEEKIIADFIRCLPPTETIIIDGGSSDKTPDKLKDLDVFFIETRKPSRALQLNRGASYARGNILVFLHCDCYLQTNTLLNIKRAIKKGYVGGCLSQKINSRGAIWRFIEFSGNLRARLFKIFYGDQGIFVRRDIFFKIGGFPSVPLFEDVLFSKKLKREGKVCVLGDKIFTSPRRWQRQGIIKTTFINWLVSLGFVFGMSPDKLKRFYKDIR